MMKFLRKREDSNLRSRFRLTAFRVRPIQPLWHASLMVLLSPRKESDPHLFLRTELLYPLSYEGLHSIIYRIICHLSKDLVS